MTDIGQIESFQDPVKNQQQNNIGKNNSKSSVYLTVFIIFLLILIFGGAVYYYTTGKMKQSIVQTTMPVSSISPAATPTPEIIDTAPAIPANQKARILIHHSDSTFSVYLVPVSAVAAYEKTIPQGDTIVKVTNLH